MYFCVLKSIKFKQVYKTYLNWNSKIPSWNFYAEWRKFYLLVGRNIQNLCAKKIQQNLASWAVWNHIVGFWVVSWKWWDPLLWNQLLSRNRDLRPQVLQSSCAKDWKKMIIKQLVYWAVYCWQWNFVSLIIGSSRAKCNKVNQHLNKFW